MFKNRQFIYIYHNWNLDGLEEPSFKALWLVQVPISLLDIHVNIIIWSDNFWI